MQACTADRSAVDDDRVLATAMVPELSMTPSWATVPVWPLGLLTESVSPVATLSVPVESLVNVAADVGRLSVLVWLTSKAP